MAAHGQSVADAGNQVFVTLRKGKEFPPRTCDVRIKYEQTLADVKQAVASKLGIPTAKQRLFIHGREADEQMCRRTLLELGIHTGFGISGYDLTEAPDYWPPVEQTSHGLVICT